VRRHPQPARHKCAVQPPTLLTSTLVPGSTLIRDRYRSLNSWKPTASVASYTLPCRCTADGTRRDSGAAVSARPVALSLAASTPLPLSLAALITTRASPLTRTFSTDESMHHGMKWRYSSTRATTLYTCDGGNASRRRSLCRIGSGLATRLARKPRVPRRGSGAMGGRAVSGVKARMAVGAAGGSAAPRVQIDRPPTAHAGSDENATAAAGAAAGRRRAAAHTLPASIAVSSQVRVRARASARAGESSGRGS
jgi:hypothetical protein